MAYRDGKTKEYMRNLKRKQERGTTGRGHRQLNINETNNEAFTFCMVSSSSCPTRNIKVPAVIACKRRTSPHPSAPTTTMYQPQGSIRVNHQKSSEHLFAMCDTRIDMHFHVKVQSTCKRFDTPYEFSD